MSNPGNPLPGIDGAAVDQRDLVIRAKGGDHDAFTTLAGAAIARLDAAARLILRDGELARDAVQDTLVRAWRDLPGLRDPDRFDVWLHRITVHACLDLARRRRRRSIEVELTPIVMPSVADSAPDIAERQLLDDALELLDPGWRAIVVMHFYLGMPMPDIAVALRIPLGTAKSRLHRALRDMRVTLAEPEPLEDGMEPVREGQPA
jgi:RNA polymerase sigma-70 factor, ECF subfamily